MNSLRGYLLGMAILLAVLFCAATAVVVREVDAFRREQSERALLDTTRAMSQAVDGQLESYEATLLALRQSGALERDDWTLFDRQARALLAGPDVWITVADRTGRQFVNTRLPIGAPLPSEPPRQGLWPSLDRGEVGVCDLTRRASGQVVCVDVPVMRDGRAAYHLSVVFRPQLLQRFMDRQGLNDGRIAAIADRHGVLIWRNRLPERFVGRPTTPTIRQAMAHAREGVTPSLSLEGTPTVAAFSRSPVSGWTVVVGVPRRQMAAGGEKALRYGLAAATAFVLAGAAIAIGAGRRLTRAMGRLSAAAYRIRAGEPPAFEASGIQEVDAVGAVLDAAITERDATQERFNLAQEVGGIGSWEWDMIKDEGLVSDAYKEMHGVSHIPGPLKVAQVMGAILPEDLPGYRARMIEGMHHATATTNEYRVMRPDGSIRWVAAKGRPLFGPNGRAIGGIGVVMDMTDRKLAEERLRFLMREVDHRANNLMAVIQGVVTLSRAADAEQLREIILGRVAAIARAHQLLAESRWQGADLHRLAEEEMEPFTLGEAGRVVMSGPMQVLAPAAAQAVAMAFHELGTNASKYGALSTPRGRVDISWTTGGGMLRIRWAETGGPPVSEPTRKGFGTTVLQRAFSGALRGCTRLGWRVEGLVCELELPLDAAEGPGHPSPTA